PRGIPDLFSFAELRRCDALTAARDGRNDRYLVTSLEVCLEPLEEAYVFTVDVDVDEAADLAAFVADPLLQAGVLRLQGIDTGLEAAVFAGDDVELVGQLAQWCWNTDFDGHTN